MENLLQNPDFVSTWNTYNEYLLENFGIELSDDDKKNRMDKLEKNSKNNPKVAIEILEIMISRGETTIFMPDGPEFIDN